MKRHYKAITLAAMCLAIFMTNFNDAVIDVALPEIQKSVGADISGLQWILNASVLPVASLLLATGTLGDIYGRKLTFLVGLVIFTIGSIICGVAVNLEVLLAGRTFQGIGAAAIIPLSLTILTDTFPNPKEKTKAIGIWSAVSAFALLAGPALSGLLVDNLGWQSIFFLNVPLGLITFWITSRFVKKVIKPSKKFIDVPGLVTSIILLASLTYALTEGSGGTWNSPQIIGLLAVAGLSFAAFIVIESQSNHPILPLHLFKNSTFAVVNIIQFLVFFTFSSLLFIFSLFFQQVQGYSATATGMRFLPMNVAIIIASLVSGWLAARWGWRFPIIGGLVLASIGTLLLTQVGADTEYGIILWGFILSGFGGGLTIAPIATAAMNSVPSNQEGVASGVYNISINLGAIVGIALQGTIFMQRQVSDLGQSLSAWGIPEKVQNRIIPDALNKGTKFPHELLGNISESTFEQAVNNAFVSGLHAIVLVSSFSFIFGILLVLKFIRPTSNKKSNEAL